MAVDAESETDAPWSGLVGRPGASARDLEAVLMAMEQGCRRYGERLRQPAEWIAAHAADAGWTALQKRAELIGAYLLTRNGELAAASARAQEVNGWAVLHANPYLEARSAFVLAMVTHALGNRAKTQLLGLRCVELLRSDAPIAIRIDHLLVAAVGYGPGTPEGDRWYAEALDLATGVDDGDTILIIHNNQAWRYYESGDHAMAWRHCQELQLLSVRFGIPLKPVILDTIARVQLLNRDFDGALLTLHPIIDGTAPEGLEPYAVGYCLTAAASAHRLAGRLEQASLWLARAREVATRSLLQQVLTEVHHESAILHAARGDFDLAFSEYVQFHELGAKLSAKADEEHARLVRAAYEVESAERDAQRFRELAYRDALTGLYNRRFIDEQLSRLCEQAAHEHQPLSAAIVDADHFKRINDELSHEQGDAVLRTLAGLLDAHVNAPLVLGRLGGEEFVVLLPHTGGSEAARRCERLRYVVQSHDWSPLTGTIPVTVSIGVSSAPHGHTSPGALLADADRNLYAAKRAGRNRVMADPIDESAA